MGFMGYRSLLRSAQQVKSIEKKNHYFMNHLKQMILMGLAFLVSGVGTHVLADPKIHTTISSKSFYVGEEFTYEILVSGAKKVSQSEPDSTENLRVQFVEKILLPQKDGTQPPDVALRYRMIPMSPGMVPLPMFEVETDGGVLMTDEEAFVEVRVPEGYPGLTLTRTLPSRDLYVGEAFRADYVWTSPLPLSGYRAIQLNLPLFYDASFRVRSPYHWIDGDDKAAIGLPVSNTRVIAKYGSFEKARQFYNTVSFSKIVVPSKTGEYLVRRATLLASYISPPPNQRRGRAWRTNYPSYFNNNFFERIEGEEFKKYFVASQQQKIRVLPLPDAGKPHDFAGQVGKRRVHVTATPKVVAAGDPITLVIEVDDCEFPEVVELPALEDQVAFSRQFIIPSNQSRGRIDGKKKTYIFTLRPRAQDVSAIPAVRLPYFDPLTKTYGVAESKPIPITVKAAETATAFDAVVSGSGPLRNLLEANKEGIRANVTQLDSYQGIFTKNQWMWLLWVAPPVGFFLFLWLSAHQRLMRRDPVRARAKQALTKFRASITRLEKSEGSLKPEELAQQLDDTVRCYFSDKLNLVRHAHTFEELEAVLRKRMKEEGRFDDLRDIYAFGDQEVYRCGGASDGNGHVDVTPFLCLAKQTILTIDKKL
jgi:hypothetical protein